MNNPQVHAVTEKWLHVERVYRVQEEHELLLPTSW